MMSIEHVPAGRVYQLEAYSLDCELSKVVDNYVDRIDIPIFANEVKLATKLFLSTMLSRSSTTLGKKVYNMYLSSSNETRGIPSSENIKLCLLTSLNLILPYALDKISLNRISESLKAPWLTIDNLTRHYKILRLINFLAFLRDGKYLLPQERLLGLRPVISVEDHHLNMGMNRVQMEILDREVIWKALAEFLLTVAPFVNGSWIKNKCNQVVKKVTGEKQVGVNSIKSRQDHSKCSLCERQPFNPFTIDVSGLNCSHVFCYYCLQVEHLNNSNKNYTCPVCKYECQNIDKVRPYIQEFERPYNKHRIY